MSVSVSTAPALAFFSSGARSIFFTPSLGPAFAWTVGFSGLFMWVPVFVFSACNLAFQFAQMGARLVSAFIDMGRQRPLAQRVAQFTAQEPAGGIAGSA